MANDLRLQVLLNAIDKATAPLRQISQGSLETARSLKAARDRLKELNTQQKDVSAWREMQSANRETAAALEASNAKLGELSRATAKVRQQLAPTQALVEKSKQKFDALKDTQGELKRELTSSRDALGLVRDEYTKARSQIAALNAVTSQGNTLTDKQRAEYEQLTTAQRARKVELDQLAAKEKTLAERYSAGNAQLRTVRAGHSNLRDELRRLEQPHKTQLALLQQQTNESKRLGERYGQQNAKLASLGAQLKEAGINTNALGAHELKLKRQIDSANQAISTQSGHLETLRRKQEALAKARSTYDKTQSTAGSMAASGAAGLGVGYAASRPVASAIKAFAPNEDSATQLKVSMMDDTGKVSEDFQKITDLATRLGDRLPGTTAEFQEMMTMLRRQGLSAQSILGGTGEAAAYLGVQLKMPVTEAAEFAAKMQDATRTSEKDMMALMDTIQRGFYMGVDSGNMLQGFSKISPVMDTIKKSGLEAAKELAPLLVMMDQAGMEGGAAGNAFRKIFQAGLDKDNIKDVNKIMEIEGKPIRFKFTDDKGNFAGLENLYAQIEKLKVLNDEDRTSAIKSLFGDDAETMTVLNTMMNKGLAGYQEVQQKLQAQADLRKRVNEQLQTLSNVWEAAEGSFTNAMAEFGAAVAPELKDLIKTLGDVANGVGAWARENPQLAGGLVKVVALVAALAFGFGGLALTMASLLGPFAMLRYGMTLFGIKGGGALSIGRQLLPTFTNLAKSAVPMLVSGVRVLATTLSGGLLTALRTVSIALWGLAANPVVLAIAAVVAVLAGAGYLIYQNWDQVKLYFANAWTEIKAGFSGGIGGILTTLANFSPIGLIYQAFAGVLSYLGVDLPTRFTEFGNMIVNGLVNGLMAGAGQIKEAITSIGGSTIDWFKEKLGIHSPSRVFAELGGFTMAGLTQGLQSGEQGPLDAVAQISKQLTNAGSFVMNAITGPSSMGEQRTPAEAAGVAQPVRAAQAIAQPTASETSGAGSAVLGMLTSLGKQLTNAGASVMSAIVGPSATGEQRSPAEAAGVAQPLKAVQSTVPTAGEPTGAEAGVLATLASLGKQFTAAGAMALGSMAAPVMAMGTAVTPAIEIDNRAPVAPQAAVTYDSHDHYEINIHPTPGMDAQAVARAVRAELTRIDREKSARKRSQLSDQE